MFDIAFFSCYNLFTMKNEILEKFNNQDKKFDKIDKTLEEHSKKFDKIDKTLKEHSKKFDKIDERFDGVDKKFDDMDKKFDKRFDEMEGRFDLLAINSLDHEERLKNIEENMATKSDIRKIMDVLDVLVGMFKKHDQEFVFMKTRFERNEEKIDKNTKDIKKIKQVLSFS